MGLINYMGLWASLLAAAAVVVALVRPASFLAPAVQEGLVWILLLAALIGGVVLASLAVGVAVQMVSGALGAWRARRRG